MRTYARYCLAALMWGALTGAALSPFILAGIWLGENV